MKFFLFFSRCVDCQESVDIVDLKETHDRRSATGNRAMNVADHTVALGFESSFEVFVGFSIATGVVGWLWVVLDGFLSWRRLGLLN